MDEQEKDQLIWEQYRKELERVLGKHDGEKQQVFINSVWPRVMQILAILSKNNPQALKLIKRLWPGYQLNTQ